MTLNEKMDLDHVVEVLIDGTVTDAYGVHAPEYVDDVLTDDTWSLMTGYTGQHGYNGPVMHNSEYIGGRMEHDILEGPGFYVAVPALWTDDEVDGEGTIEGWVVAYKPSA